MIVAVFYVPLGGLNVHTVAAQFGWIGEVGNSVSKLIAIGLIQLGGWLLWLAGLLFNQSIELSVVEFSTTVTRASGFINEAWEVIRDLVNMSFIFILLWMAFKMILNLGGDVRKMLVNVIIVALLVNFSLAITKIIIDASNIVTLQFYNQITAVPTGTSPTNVPGTNINDKGISDIFMQSMRLGTLFDNKGIGTKDMENLGVKLLLIGVAGFALTAGAAVIFFMVAVSFIIRMAVFMFLMVTSPIMFMNWILPKIPSDKWWKSLSNQALFAPVFMLFMWITVKMIQSNAFKDLMGNASFSESFGTEKTANNPELATLFIGFGIILTFLIMSLRTARQFGAIGTDWAGKAFGGLALGGAAFAARNTLGRVASRAANSDWLKNKAESSLWGEYALKSARGVAGGSLDLRALRPVKAAAGAAGINLGVAQRGGYEKTLKERVGTRVAFGASLGERKYTEEGKEVKESRAKGYAERLERPFWPVIQQGATILDITKANREAAKKILDPVEKRRKTKERRDVLKTNRK